MKTVKYIGAALAAVVCIGSASSMQKKPLTFGSNKRQTNYSLSKQPTVMTQKELERSMGKMSLDNKEKKALVPISGLKSGGMSNPGKPGSLSEAYKPGQKTQINMGNQKIFTKFDGQKPVIIQRPSKSKL